MAAKVMRQLHLLAHRHFAGAGVVLGWRGEVLQVRPLALTPEVVGLALARAVEFEEQYGWPVALVGDPNLREESDV